MTALKYDAGKTQEWLLDSRVVRAVEAFLILHDKDPVRFVDSWDVLAIADQHDKPATTLLLLGEMMRSAVTSWEGIADVLEFGTKKYAAHNWREGMEWSRLVSAARRHLRKDEAGEREAFDSLLPHVDHAACNLMFLLSYMFTGSGTDDLYYPPVTSKRADEK